MDDHLYDMVKSYAECELIPRFQEEYRRHKKMSDCPSYKEMRDFVIAINHIALYAGYNPVRVSDFTPIIEDCNDEYIDPAKEIQIQNGDIPYWSDFDGGFIL